jgi:hypothetical protein
MAKDLDKNGRRFETGQPCSYKGAAFVVAGGHEDGVSLVDADGHRTVIHAAGENCADVEITGDAPDAAGLDALHAKWVAQADANRLALAKG